MKEQMQIANEELRKVILVLLAVNHKLRQRMSDLLADKEKATVTEIYIK